MFNLESPLNYNRYEENTKLPVFFHVILSQITFGQKRPAIAFDIPTEYLDQFKKDENKFLEYIKRSDESVGNAFNLWSSATKGQWKDYNLDSVYSIYDSLKSQNYTKIIEFIKNNPDSYASIYYFHQRLLNKFILTPDSLISIYSLLNENLRATPFGRFIKDTLEKKESLLLNREMPVFLFKTDKGQQFDLSKFRNEKHVLICFWASWCGPCIKNIPLLKKIEETYRDKGLQIISISIDQDREKWLKAVEKYDMPWLQTCDLPAYISERTMRTLYEVHYIPQYFLIDKKGDLIYQNFQSKDDDDYTVLKCVLAANVN